MIQAGGFTTSLGKLLVQWSLPQGDTGFQWLILRMWLGLPITDSLNSNLRAVDINKMGYKNQFLKARSLLVKNCSGSR